MDKLFSEGAYLINNFTTTPVCSPSRAGLMVSKYGTEVGITDYINPGRNPELGLDPGHVTWAEVLQRAGYATGFFGKWHLGVQDRYLPTRQGYDEFSGFRNGGSISKDPEVEIGGEVKRRTGFTPDILTNLAIDFIRRNREGPFLVSLHFWAPHANTDNRSPDGDRTWLPLSDEDWSQFNQSDPLIPNPDYPNLDIPRVKRMMREYLASVASVDRNLGRLLDLLDHLELSDDTVVIFSSDHGFNMGHNGIWHKGNGRWIVKGMHPRERNAGEALPEARPNLYDNSLRTPTAVRWPGIVQAGTVVRQTTSNLDWYPTIVAIAGLELPEGELVRGRDLTPLLKGESVPWDDSFYGQYSLDHGGVKADLRCWRTNEWKLVRDFRNEGRDELYYLVSDPAESSNLIVSQDPLIQRMRKELNAQLLEHMSEISDPLLTSGK
jgi:uncharacterized sulfatase